MLRRPNRKQRPFFFARAPVKKQTRLADGGEAGVYSKNTDQKELTKIPQLLEERIETREQKPLLTPPHPVDRA